MPQNSRSERNLYKREWYKKNKATEQEARRNYRNGLPTDVRKERARRYHLKSRFGLTPEQFETLLEAQGRKCAICRSDTPNHFRGWNVDHCHRTGAVRGILCHHCNLMLGNAKDNPAILSAAISYLERINGAANSAHVELGAASQADDEGSGSNRMVGLAA